jgi:hypothetical protein
MEKISMNRSEPGNADHGVPTKKAQTLTTGTSQEGGDVTYQNSAGNEFMNTTEQGLATDSVCTKAHTASQDVDVSGYMCMNANRSDTPMDPRLPSAQLETDRLEDTRDVDVSGYMCMNRQEGQQAVGLSHEGFYENTERETGSLKSVNRPDSQGKAVNTKTFLTHTNTNSGVTVSKEKPLTQPKTRRGAFERIRERFSGSKSETQDCTESDRHYQNI